jgi:hypothetical protein
VSAVELARGAAEFAVRPRPIPNGSRLTAARVRGVAVASAADMHTIRQHVYAEGRCRECGRRVTVERSGAYHIRNARRCGPVDTDHPSAMPDEASGRRWIGHPPRG